MMPMSYASPWHKVAAPPAEQTFERELCSATVVVTEIDFAQAGRELAHANEQIAIQRQYPGRERGR
jgi:hypothetical protein